jgi:hypothetical protein
MKVLFVMRHPAAVRSFGSVLRLLDARGHDVHLVFRRIKTAESHRELRRLVEECARIDFAADPRRGSPGWNPDDRGWMSLAQQLRLDADFLRYLEPRYADANELRARAEVKAGTVVRQLGRAARALRAPAVARSGRWVIEGVETRIEPPSHVTRYVQDKQPDVVLVTHLAEFGSGQTDYVRAAKRLGIPTGYAVFSWDNLTNKGLVHDLPDTTLVWNDLQAREAEELQRIPSGRIRVTGSPAYDHWFSWGPSRTREEFCAEVGLRADRPIVLYVCSSSFIAPDEVSFVRRWIRELRAHGGELAEAGIVVRLHPRNSGQWAAVDLDEPQVVIWPRLGEEPLDESSRRNYFDSIYHSAAVVGINTSAQIESAIVGRPVHTVLAEEFRDTQQGTLHFEYLRADDFGHLYVGRTMAEHAAQLEESLRGRPSDDRNRRFLERFVRPQGLDVPVSPLYVDEIERIAAAGPVEQSPGPPLGRLVRTAVTPLAWHEARRDNRKRIERQESPLDELRRSVRRLARQSARVPIVAGPWTGDEIGELLYWIPFLRWAEIASFGIAERLVVIARAANAPWYAGLHGTLHSAEEVGPVRTAFGEDSAYLPASLVEERRAELSLRHPAERFLRRFLEIGPLEVPPLPDGVSLPESYAAARFAPTLAFPDTELSRGAAASAVQRLLDDGPAVLLTPSPDLLDHLPVSDSLVVVDAADRRLEAAILGRATAFVGGYDASAVVAALTGCPTLALYSAPEAVDEGELNVVASFLGRRPLGSLRALSVDDAGGVAEAVRELGPERAAPAR